MEAKNQIDDCGNHIHSCGYECAVGCEGCLATACKLDEETIGEWTEEDGLWLCGDCHVEGKQAELDDAMREALQERSGS